MPINPGETDFIFRSYNIFERKMLDILETFPLSTENRSAWSPELVNLFLDISSLIDSLSRQIIAGNRDVDDDVTVTKRDGTTITKKVRSLDIEDFEVNIYNGLNLLNSNVVVYVYPLQIIKPYENYRDASTGWWSIYNLRIQNYSRANLDNTLKALAGFFLLLARYPEEELSKALYRLGWVETGIVPEYVHSERLREPWRYWYDSALFAGHEVPSNITSDLNTINAALTSNKFRKFLGRFNPPSDGSNP